MLVGLVCYVGQKHHRRIVARRQRESKGRRAPSVFFQLKSELDAEGNRRGELEGFDVKVELGDGDRYEIEGDGSRAEMIGLDRERGMLPSLIERHELRGEEHVRELDGRPLTSLSHE